MAHLCDVCAARPATVRLAVLRNGQRHVLDVCDFHYAQLTRHQRALSPLESLFLGGAPEQPAMPVPSSRPVPPMQPRPPAHGAMKPKARTSTAISATARRKC